MRESRLYGFVRGALSNERPYRVSAIAAMRESTTGPKRARYRRVAKVLF